MKFVILLIIGLVSVSCSGETDIAESVTEITGSVNKATVNIEAEPQTNMQKQVTVDLPDISDYKGICPKAWGIVEGAAQAHVDKFVQNYFYVPDNAGQMYSEINTLSQADGSSLLKAGTYKMQDDAVDQEMVAVFVSGKMTQCGFRLRCASNPSVWVSSCD